MQSRHLQQFSRAPRNKTLPQCTQHLKPHLPSSQSKSNAEVFGSKQQPKQQQKDLIHTNLTSCNLQSISIPIHNTQCRRLAMMWGSKSSIPIGGIEPVHRKKRYSISTRELPLTNYVPQDGKAPNNAEAPNSERCEAGNMFHWNERLHRMMT